MGTSKWSLSEKFRNWELVLGRKLVLGTASQFVIRKHEKFSQWIILSNLKFSGVNLLENALCKLNFDLKVKVFESWFTNIRFRNKKKNLFKSR